MNSNLRWNLEDAPWAQLRAERLTDNAAWRYLLCSASFIEITTDLYTQALLDYFADDADVAGWLRDEWEGQELQHGRALRAYVEHVWPDFDWPRVYAAFRAEYAPLISAEALMPKHSLEMVARCVVEMGTSTYYTALNRATDEPVLKWLTQRIYEDEIAHYKHFLRYFQAWRDRDGASRREIALTLWRRLKMIEAEDSWVVTKHVHAALYPGEAWDDRVYRAVIADCRRTVAAHFPHRMSVKMLLHPLDVGPRMQRLLIPPLTGVARLVA
ncbi:MAG: ferritin-like domain-containing protein [Nevskiaceae bacterium]|nr:MAG: ferritin-like domain-containing protein [Nevskiaceae bacterium]TBR72740.1 MAG: ferritin-like domain-containing protein [Nevskiaceae bacterium]